MVPLDDKTRGQIVVRVLAEQQQRDLRLAQMKERQQQGLEVARKWVVSQKLTEDKRSPSIGYEIMQQLEKFERAYSI
jgi:hypothetical protein